MDFKNNVFPILNGVHAMVWLYDYNRTLVTHEYAYEHRAGHGKRKKKNPKQQLLMEVFSSRDSKTVPATGLRSFGLTGRLSAAQSAALNISSNILY